MSGPLVSILMVARNAVQFIDAAIFSAREQSMADIEIVVVDDGSTDGTAAIVRAHADCDERVRFLQGPGRGLSAVRNASLAAARGRYAVILDSDDILHPRHVEWLVTSHMQHGAEMCVSNMIEFQQNGTGFTANLFAQGVLWGQIRSIRPAEFLERGMIGVPDVSLGYLKPLLDLNFLRSHRIAYDERLRIGEDFDLVLRAMLAGGRLLYVPQASYYYRKHPTSVSYRLEHSDLEGLLRATQDYASTTDDPIHGYLDARSENLRGALHHLDTIAAFKAGRITTALKLLLVRSDARRLTLSSLREAVVKRASFSGRVPKGANCFSLSKDESLSDRLRAISQALPAAVFSS